MAPSPGRGLAGGFGLGGLRAGVDEDVYGSGWRHWVVVVVVVGEGSVEIKP